METAGENARKRTRNARTVIETSASTRPKRTLKARAEDAPAQKRTKVAAAASSGVKEKEKKGKKLNGVADAKATTTNSSGGSGKGRARPSKVAREQPKAVRSNATTPSSPKASPKAEVGDAVKDEEEDQEEGGRSYWLMKAEPESRIEKGVDVKFSIDDLREAAEPEPWDGVRNPAARNHMRAMKKGDLAFFYHSNCKVPGIAGVMEIVKEHSIDESAFDPAHPYYDPKSVRENPKWSVVHVEFRAKFDNLITLADIKSLASPGKPLDGLQMTRQTRLSVSAVTRKQWKYLMSLAELSDADKSALGG